MAETVALIGLGNMGLAMAKNLLKGGVSLYVYNRTPEKAAPLVELGAKLLHDATEVFEKASIAITMLSNDQALEEVTKSLLEKIKPGCIHLSMSTISPDTSEKLKSQHSEKQAFYIAAPVFGRPDVAEMAKLWICIAGPQEAKLRVLPLLKLLGQRIEDFGELPGKANVVKLSGNFLILSALEALGEAFKLGKAHGIEPEKLAAFFSETLFPSPVYQTYGKIIATAKYSPAGFKLNLGLKDLTLVQKTAHAAEVSMPFAELLKSRLEEAIVKGRGDLDWSSVSL